MNIIKKLLDSSSSSAGSKDLDELITIPTAQLFLRRLPQSPKGELECIYNDCVASIRRTSVAFNYQLVIQKSCQEGESENDEYDGEDDSNSFDDDLKDEWNFLIDCSLNFAQETDVDKNLIYISWKDVNGDLGDKFQLIIDKKLVKAATIDAFIEILYRCEYERKYNKSSDDCTYKQLINEFENYTDQNNDVDSSDEEHDFFEDATDGKDDKDLEKKLIQGTLVVEEIAELRLFDPETASFKLYIEKATVKVLELNNWEYWLSVEDSDNGKAILGTSVNSQMNPVFNFDNLCFIFNYFHDNTALSWLLRFDSFEKLSSFQEGLTRSLWESMNKIKWIKVKDDERDYVLDAFNNLVLEDELEDSTKNDNANEEEEEESEQEEIESRVSNIRSGVTKQEAEDDEDEDEDEAAQRKYLATTKDTKNSQLKVGYKNNRTYVSRGDKLGVFVTNEDDELKFNTTINIKNPTTKNIVNPSKMMLHMEDRAMILQDPNDKSNLYKMDLEYGKIVEEYKVKDDLKVVDFNPLNKFAQLGSEQTFLGISSNGLFKIDPRVSGDKLVESEFKQYASKNDFSTMATTENGYIAVASNKGDIRLYDRLGINAKTQLPALGDPIVGLDVSRDGRWLLATCKTYLLLIDNKIKTGKNSGELGFKKSFGKDSKPRPRRITVSPEHAAFMSTTSGNPLSFTKAHFNAGIDAKEQTIVTSTGPYVVTWSLKKILQGDKDNTYLIKRYNSDVMNDNFKFGSDKNIIIALQDDVAMVNKGSFRKPTRESLGYKKNSIVKGYY
ncbi:hypothetical protein PACTADRAFT_49180 [Pachysolen tannophilus NRRL Y-2460]|uniref:Vacuolar import/degradation Vid27 C-terminal domain-containing protein n=1 Tax=Pachysolen tannophilus NRRL Y-2460 TaxID=669874 RepID=A0A1E4U0E2_PACTA|nr:hypothetical protein PACTADRAFT_49180 [Pachysolen tannophilus NRRL Y-2460]